MNRSRLLVCCIAVCAAQLGADPASSAGRGGIYVVDGRERVVRIDPKDGSQREVELPRFIEVDGVAVSIGGDLVLSDAGAPSGRDGEIQVVDPWRGDSGVLSDRELLVDPWLLAIDTANTVYAAGDRQDLVSIDPRSRRQTRIVQVGSRSVRGLAVDRKGRPILLLEDGGDLSVVRVDPATGDESTLSRNGLLRDPHGLAVDCKGRIFTVDAQRRIVRIRAGNGAQKVVAEGAFIGATDLAADRLGDLLVSSDVDRVVRLLRVDPGTGAVEPLSTDDLLADPGAIAVGVAPSDADPLTVCGGHADLTGTDRITLPGEGLDTTEAVDVDLRLGAGFFHMQIVGGPLVEGAARAARTDPKRVELDPDRPSRDRLLAWATDLVAALRGEPVELREDGRPKGVLKLQDGRQQAEVRLRMRLEADTSPEILPLKLRVKVSGPLSGVKSAPGSPDGDEDDGDPLRPRPENPGTPDPNPVPTG